MTMTTRRRTKTAITPELISSQLFPAVLIFSLAVIPNSTIEQAGGNAHGRLKLYPLSAGTV
jgi:hypothetical protein